MGSRSRRGLRALPLAAALGALHALALAALPAGASAEEPGTPGRPELVDPGAVPEPAGVVVEGRLRAQEPGADAALMLEGVDGRLYEIVNRELARILASHAGKRLVVEGTVQTVPDGPDALVVERVRFGEP